MKIPPDAIIADEKLTEYLLIPKPRNDKSALLALVGFTRENADQLKAAIRELTDQAEASVDQTTEYGTSYLVEGELKGLNNRNLPVILVWFQRAADQRFYFITLKPSKGK